MNVPTTADKGRAFLDMHHAGRGFLMPNAWDAGTALILAGERFGAIGTTSAGIAFSLGKPDYNFQDQRLAVTRAEMLDAVRRIAGAVPIPVNADLEDGYGQTPEQVAETVGLAIACGAAGCNIEDVERTTGRLFDVDAALARIAAARTAIKSSGKAFVLNARTDSVLLGDANDMRMAIERGNRYLEAGADCVFVPGVTDVVQARVLVREIAGPLNLVMGLNEAASSASALLDAGVKRISVGGSIARAVLGFVRRSGQELRDHGTVSFAAGQIPHGELNALFSKAS